MPRKHFRKFLPDAAATRSNRYVAMFGSLLHHPNLWHLNRHSVAGGVAIGMFAGLVPGPFQLICAALLAVPARVNLPVALITTLYTNPFTIVPLYFAAYEYGKLLLSEHGERPTVQPFEMDWAHLLDSLHALFDWMLLLGKPLAVGLVALSLTLAAVGYFAVMIGWRAYVTLAWRARRRRRQARRA